MNDELQASLNTTSEGLAADQHVAADDDVTMKELKHHLGQTLAHNRELQHELDLTQKKLKDSTSEDYKNLYIAAEDECQRMREQNATLIMKLANLKDDVRTFHYR